MLVVDLLHEIELGVWKVIFTHLLRLLDAAKQGMVHELDHQSASLTGLYFSFGWYHIQLPPSAYIWLGYHLTLLLQFFQDAENGSERFQGSFTGMVTSFVLSLFSWSCSVPSLFLRTFYLSHTMALWWSFYFYFVTCHFFHQRASSWSWSPNKASGLGDPSETGRFVSSTNNTYASTRKVKTLNLQTYKLHALGDYVEQIWTYGTTDSYSTQSVSYQGLVICWSLGFYFSGGAWALLEKVDLFVWAEKNLFHNLLQLNDIRHAPTAFDQSWLLKLG